MNILIHKHLPTSVLFPENGFLEIKILVRYLLKGVLITCSGYFTPITL